MFLDPSYDQAEISASKVQERMKQWNSDPFMRSLVSYYKIEVNIIFSIYLLIFVLFQFECNDKEQEEYSDTESNNNDEKEKDNSSDDNENNEENY